MMYQERPANFQPRFEIVSCFLEAGSEILLLHRHSHKAQGNTWGVPAGKVEPGEDLHGAIVRELHEETGLDVQLKELEYFRKVYVRYPDYDFVYHIFHLPVAVKPTIAVNLEEHGSFKWVTPHVALMLALIPDLGACIKLYYNV